MYRQRNHYSRERRARREDKALAALEDWGRAWRGGAPLEERERLRARFGRAWEAAAEVRPPGGWEPMPEDETG